MGKTSNKNFTLIHNLLLLLIFTLALWVYGLTVFVGSIPKIENIDDTTETDGIVILTGGSNRLDTAIKLLNEGKAEKLLISGVGQESNLASILILSGELPDNIVDLLDKIELGYEAQDTMGNAEEALKWVNENNYKSIRLVTANYHINRSMTEFAKLMPHIKIIPNPVMPNELILDNWWQHGPSKKLLVIEYNKFLVSQITRLFK